MTQNVQPDVDELVFTVESDLDGGVFVAYWNDPAGGGITTQADTRAELTEMIKEAVDCHFPDGLAPRRVSLHFTNANSANVELELA